MIERLKELEAKATPGPLALIPTAHGYQLWEKSEFEKMLQDDDDVYPIAESSHNIYGHRPMPKSDVELYLEMRNAMPKIISRLEAGQEMREAIVSAERAGQLGGNLLALVRKWDKAMEEKG